MIFRRLSKRSDLTSVILRPRPETEEAEEGGCMVVMDPHGRRFYGLDAVATRIWHLLDGRTLGDVAEAMAGEHEVPYDQVYADLIALCDDLRSKKLIREVHG